MKMSLEVSKQLKEIGVKQKGDYYWMVSVGGKPHIVDKEVKEFYSERTYNIMFTSAFTISELPEVFKQIGRIKAESSPIIGGYLMGNWTWGKVEGKEVWLHYYLELCQIYATKGEEEANKYIQEILK